MAEIIEYYRMYILFLSYLPIVLFTGLILQTKTEEDTKDPLRFGKHKGKMKSSGVTPRSN